ncbi:MAG: metal ABC transporter permease [Bacteroidaceae bacterium]
MDILHYLFFQHAIMGSLLASVLCGIVGTYIVTRRLVFIGGGIAHASLGGVGIGAFFGFQPLLGAAFFSLFSGYSIQWLSRRHEVREDSAIAMLWTFGMSVGILFTYLSPDFMPQLSSYLFGNILTITKADLWMMGFVTLAAIVLFTLFRRTIVAVAFDSEFAQSQGLPVRFLEYAMMTLIALTIVSCLRMVGIVLVISMLSIPQMTANLFTQSFQRMMALSIVVGMMNCMGGLAFSFLYNVPSGASIIFVSILIYIVAKTIKSLIYSLLIKK